MTVEAATYLDTLNPANPASGDQRSEGDDHMRLLKAVLQATFPNITGPVTASQTELNQADGATLLSTTTAGQMVLMKAVTVSGSPSAIDFVNGSGGVVLTTAYDEFLIVLSNIRHASSTNAKLRMGFSQDAGSTFTSGLVSGVTINASDATLTSASIGSIAYLPVTGELANASATGAPGIGAFIRLTRPTGYDSSMDCIVDWRGYNSGGGRGGAVRAFADTASGDIDGLRLYWDSGNFANTGSVKLYGRKV
jgi:hypothetical protein